MCGCVVFGKALGIFDYEKLTLVQILVQKNFILPPGRLHMSTPGRSFEIIDLSEKTGTIMFQPNIPDM